LEDADAEHAEEQRAFEHEMDEARKREDAARRAFEAKRAKLDAALQAQAKAYEHKMSQWRAD